MSTDYQAQDAAYAVIDQKYEASPRGINDLIAYYQEMAAVEHQFGLHATAAASEAEVARLKEQYGL